MNNVALVLGCVLFVFAAPRGVLQAQAMSTCSVKGAPGGDTAVGGSGCYLEVPLCSRYERIVRARTTLQPKFSYDGRDLGVTSSTGRVRLFATLCSAEASPVPCESPEGRWVETVVPGDQNPERVPQALLESDTRGNGTSRYVILWKEGPRSGFVYARSTPFTVTSKSSSRRIECTYDYDWR